MFNFLTQTKSQMISLQLGLREFGLLPHEWRIIKKSKSRFIIQSATEDELYFVGMIDATNFKKWRSIQLAGL